MIVTPCSEHADCENHKPGDDIRCTEHRHHPDDWFEDPGSGRDTEPGKARRRAIDACWVDCPMKMRLLCLDEGMKSQNLQHGIWGGYTEAQRREIADEIERRRRR